MTVVLTVIKIKVQVKQVAFRFWKALESYGISEWKTCRSPECLVFMAHDTSNILYIGFNIFERPFLEEEDTSAAVSFLCWDQTPKILKMYRKHS